MGFINPPLINQLVMSPMEYFMPENIFLWVYHKMEKTDIPNTYFYVSLTFMDFHLVWEFSHNIWDSNKGKLRSEPRVAQIHFSSTKLEEMGIYRRKNRFLLNP